MYPFYCYPWLVESGHTSKSIYIQLGPIGNGREDEKLWSSEVTYMFISIKTELKKFSLTASEYIMACSVALNDIMMVVMKTTRPNRFIYSLVLLEMDEKARSYALLKFCIGISLYSQKWRKLIQLFLLL